MKALKALLALSLLSSFAISPKTEREAKLKAMARNTVIVEKNDSRCPSNEFVCNLYKSNNALINRYSGETIKVYEFHEVIDGLSHNEIEINLSSYTTRYDF